MRAMWPFPLVTLMEADRELSGWSMQRGAYYYADTLVPGSAQYVALVDTDALFVAAVTRSALFERASGRPYVVAQVGRPLNVRVGARTDVAVCTLPLPSWTTNPATQPSLPPGKLRRQRPPRPWPSRWHARA